MNTFPNGSGFFETIKTVSGSPKFLDLHVARAQGAAKYLKITLPKADRLQTKIQKFVSDNPVETEAGRLRVEFDSAGHIHLSHNPYIAWTQPAKLTITSSKINEKSATVGIKALPYVENLELLERARAHGFDEVIRFNTRNQICEGATSNVLLKIKGEWVTPHLASGCLPGITRALVLKWFPIKERSIDRDELADVDSAFILSSLREIQPASCIGPHELIIDSAMEFEARARMQTHSLE